MQTNDVSRVYDTILSIPGMNDAVKIDLKISRKNVLLLSRVIERGLSAKGEESNLLEIIPKESLSELAAISTECLQKASLSELNEKLKSLSNTKP